MKKSRFTEEQIAYALKQSELGMAVGEICRKMGIAEATFYVWRKKYSESRSKVISHARSLRTGDPSLTARSQCCRERIEQGFGWIKTISGLCKLPLIGLDTVRS